MECLRWDELLRWAFDIQMLPGNYVDLLPNSKLWNPRHIAYTGHALPWTQLDQPYLIKLHNNASYNIRSYFPLDSINNRIISLTYPIYPAELPLHLWRLAVDTNPLQKKYMCCSTLFFSSPWKIGKVFSWLYIPMVGSWYSKKLWLTNCNVTAANEIREIWLKSGFVIGSHIVNVTTFNVAKYLYNLKAVQAVCMLWKCRSISNFKFGQIQYCQILTKRTWI